MYNRICLKYPSETLFSLSFPNEDAPHFKLSTLSRLRSTPHGLDRLKIALAGFFAKIKKASSWKLKQGSLLCKIVKTVEIINFLLKTEISIRELVFYIFQSHDYDCDSSAAFKSYYVSMLCLRRGLTGWRMGLPLNVHDWKFGRRCGGSLMPGRGAGGCQGGAGRAHRVQSPVGPQSH